MLKILILDDRAATRRALRAFAESAGAEVTDVSTAEEAWSVVSANGAPSILVCPFSELTFADELGVQFPSLRVIVIGSEFDVDAAVTSLRAGVADYVTPPLTRSRIADSIRRVEAKPASSQSALTPAQALAPTPAPAPAVEAAPRANVGRVRVSNDTETSEVISALVEILDLRDPGARDHAERVARLAVSLARALHLDPADVPDIERAGLLHDLGHLTRDGDRTKIRELGGRERQQAHQDALSILGTVTALQTATRIASAAAAAGARRSQAAAPIPLAAEILTVANAYDELVTGIGREPVPTAVAVNMLCRDASSKFDPAVLSALMAMQQQAYSRMAADAEPAKWEPRRRWPRKHLSTDLVGTVSMMPVRVVDVGYGGFRLEAPKSLPAMSAERFALDLPVLGVRTTAVCRWTKPLDRSDNIWCGAAVDGESANKWRGFVDRAQSMTTNASPA